MVFVVVSPSEEIHHHPILFFLFLFWSLIEVVRFVILMDVKNLTCLALGESMFVKGDFVLVYNKQDCKLLAYSKNSEPC